MLKRKKIKDYILEPRTEVEEEKEELRPNPLSLSDSERLKQARQVAEASKSKYAILARTVRKTQYGKYVQTFTILVRNPEPHLLGSHELPIFEYKPLYSLLSKRSLAKMLCKLHEAELDEEEKG